LRVWISFFSNRPQAATCFEERTPLWPVESGLG
jgi:hypothetical protein